MKEYKQEIYLEHLQNKDTKHVAKFIAEFCFSEAAQGMDPIFYFSAAKSLIHCFFYNSTDLSDFMNHDFFMLLFEALQNERYQTFATMILKNLFGKMESKSINFLSEDEIQSYYELIVSISKSLISTQKDNIADEACFFPLSFTTCLEQIPESVFTEELSAIVKDNLKLALTSKTASIIKLGLYSLFFFA